MYGVLIELCSIEVQACNCFFDVYIISWCMFCFADLAYNFNNAANQKQWHVSQQKLEKDKPCAESQQQRNAMCRLGSACWDHMGNHVNGGKHVGIIGESLLGS